MNTKHKNGKKIYIIASVIPLKHVQLYPKWFSATDIVRAINDEPVYTKAGNYWRWLKRKLNQEGVQLVSPTRGSLNPF